MKKLLYLFIALPFFALTACSSDDELPDVTLNIEYEGAQKVDGVYYVTQGTPFEITQLTVTPNREGAKAGISNVVYALDGMPYGWTNEAPFSQEFATENLAPGEHVIEVSMNVLEVGCSPAQAYMTINLMVVENNDETPSTGTESQTNTVSVRPIIQH
ncbi:MAG: hypothetical protein J1E38_00845 [Paramuribaculum sp.]|nr:hypothetical protein [Paramuribaculum sp.]